MRSWARILLALSRVCASCRGRGREENFADLKFFGAFGSVHLVEDSFDLVVADADAAFDLGALQPLPGDFAFDLAAQRFNVGALALQEIRQLLGRLLGVLGDPLDGLVDIGLV